MKRYIINLRGFIIFLVAGILVCFSFPALAAGPAFSGMAAKADTAETVYLNPAGMSRMSKPTWYGNPQIMYTDSVTEFTVQGQSGRQSIEDDGFIFLPGLYYVHPLNDKWSFGIGPNAVSGLGTTYNDTWPGRFLIKEWSQVMIGIVPSVAYRVNDKLSVGFSLSLNYSLFTLEKAVLDPGVGEGNFKLEADGIGVGGNLGLLYEVSPRTRLGIVYRSEVVAENEGTPEVTGLSAATKNALLNAGALNQDISMDTNMPQSVLVGVFHDYDNGWTMSADVLWVDFSSYEIDNITIGNTSINKDSNTNYQDIWAFSMGTTYALTHDWTLRGGALYLSSGLKDEDRTLLSRFDAMWAVDTHSVQGARYRWI